MSRTLLLARAVYAGDPPRPEADAIAIEDGRVTWVGPRDQAPRTRHRVDLADAVVIPSFTDPHIHLSLVATLPAWVDLSGAHSAGEVLTRLRRAAPALGPGAWLVGWGFRESLTRARHRLNRHDLDEVAADHPALLMHSSWHSGVANSAALAAVGFGRHTPHWHGGELERDLRGEPNGRAWERAYSVLEAAAIRADLEAHGTEMPERLRGVANRLLAEGVTAVNEASASPAHLAHLAATELPIDVVAMPVGPRGTFAAPREAVDGPVTGATVGHVRIGHLKLFADGAERCALRVRLPMLTKAARSFASSKTGPGPMETLRILRPKPAPGGIRLGTLHYEPDELRNLVAAASARGFSVAIHALGNEGIRAALEALEPFGGEGHRLEHAMFAEPRQAETMARLGIGAAVQPGHLYPYGELIRAAGLEKDLPPVPLRRMEIEGVSFAISSDAAGGFWEPLRTMPIAVTRQAGHGEPLAPSEAIEPESALRAATVTAARIGGIDDAGQIAPGRRANLAVLSGDPFDRGTRVLETWIDGRRVFPA